MRVLVTGGSGFIGSHVVDLLVTGGQEVVSVDNLNPAAHAGAPGYLNPAAEHRVVPLSDLAGLISAAAGIDAVCRLLGDVGRPGGRPTDWHAHHLPPCRHRTLVGSDHRGRRTATRPGTRLALPRS